MLHRRFVRGSDGLCLSSDAYSTCALCLTHAPDIKTQNDQSDTQTYFTPPFPRRAQTHRRTSTLATGPRYATLLGLCMMCKCNVLSHPETVLSYMDALLPGYCTCTLVDQEAHNPRRMSTIEPLREIRIQKSQDSYDLFMAAFLYL
jgi:hypothetical protein